MQQCKWTAEKCGAFLCELLRLIYLCLCVRACVRAIDVSNLMFLYQLQRSYEIKDVSEYEYWGDLGVDGWIILGWISRRWDVGIWTGLGWPRIGTGGGGL